MKISVKITVSLFPTLKNVVSFKNKTLEKEGGVTKGASKRVCGLQAGMKTTIQAKRRPQFLFNYPKQKS